MIGDGTIEPVVSPLNVNPVVEDRGETIDIMQTMKDR